MATINIQYIYALVQGFCGLATMSDGFINTVLMMLHHIVPSLFRSRRLRKRWQILQRWPPWMWRRWSESELCVGGEGRVVWLVKFAWIRPCVKARQPDHQVPWKFTHPITMGIPGSLYSGDFGDPVFCLRKFTTCPTLAVQVQFSKHAKCKMSECKVARSGTEGMVWDRSIVTMGDRETSHEPQPEEKATGTNRWILST